MAGEAIFIGYRRDDTADVAGRIYDALEAQFGRDRVFKDVDNIPVGANFGNYIKAILPRCRVALILIGPNWVGASDGSGARRLADPNDWVRIEIETALATSDLQVVPVLVNGAQMPRAQDLPATLQPILHLNAAVIRRDPDFRDDIQRLGNALRASVRSGFLDLGAIGGKQRASTRQSKRGSRFALPMLAACAAIVLAGAGYVFAPKFLSSNNSALGGDSTTNVTATNGSTSAVHGEQEHNGQDVSPQSHNQVVAACNNYDVAACSTVIEAGGWGTRSDVVTALKRRAIAYQGANNFSAAIRDLSEAIAMDPADWRPYYVRATDYVAATPPDDTRALEDLDHVLAVVPRDAMALQLRATILRRRGQP